MKLLCNQDGLCWQLYLYARLRTHGQVPPWESFTLIQQMNCVCNTLTKVVLTNAIINEYHQQPTQLIPKEDTGQMIWGEKITGNISPTTQFHASKEVAR